MNFNELERFTKGLYWTYRFYKTCMIFMTGDENVLVTTTGLGWPAYEKRDNSVRSCPPFLSTFRFTTLGGKYMSNLGMIKLWNELLDHVSIGCNWGAINPFEDQGTKVRSNGYGRAPLTVHGWPLRVLLCPSRGYSTLKIAYAGWVPPMSSHILMSSRNINDQHVHRRFTYQLTTL